MSHILCFPFPSQSHISSMLKLAELLTQSDLSVTFVLTEYEYRTTLRSSASPYPKLRFRTVPDGLPEDKSRSGSFIGLIESIRNNSKGCYEDLLVDRENDGWGPVTCVVSLDVFTFAQDVAYEMGVPVVLLRTSGASSGWACSSSTTQMATGEFPIQENPDMDEQVLVIKGMESFLRRRDLPGLTRHIKSVDNPILHFMLTLTKNTAKANAVIINTTDVLESTALSHLTSINSTFYPIGPLHKLLKKASLTASKWETDTSCLAWLDSQPDKSVVYVSFGTASVLPEETLVEFWHGLVNSGKRFLFVIRPDMVKLPPGLETERGRVVTWAPQTEVLAHPALGCFLTHSGWNSTLESIVAGVPMICWPLIVDQHVNSRFVSEVWKVGVDMKDLNGREVVERMVRKVMEGEDAENFRRTAEELSRVVINSTEDVGSSSTNFVNLVQYLKSLRRIKNVE